MASSNGTSDASTDWSYSSDYSQEAIASESSSPPDPVSVDPDTTIEGFNSEASVSSPLMQPAQAPLEAEPNSSDVDITGSGDGGSSSGSKVEVLSFPESETHQGDSSPQSDNSMPLDQPQGLMGLGSPPHENVSPDVQGMDSSTGTGSSLVQLPGRREFRGQGRKRAQGEPSSSVWPNKSHAPDKGAK